MTTDMQPDEAELDFDDLVSDPVDEHLAAAEMLLARYEHLPTEAWSQQSHRPRLLLDAAHLHVEIATAHMQASLRPVRRVPGRLRAAIRLLLAALAIGVGLAGWVLVALWRCGMLTEPLDVGRWLPWLRP